MTKHKNTKKIVCDLNSNPLIISTLSSEKPRDFLDQKILVAFYIEPTIKKLLKIEI